jgi:hypothetical protein
MVPADLVAVSCRRRTAWRRQRARRNASLTLAGDGDTRASAVCNISG